MTLDFWQNKVF